MRKWKEKREKENNKTGKRRKWRESGEKVRDRDEKGKGKKNKFRIKNSI